MSEDKQQMCKAAGWLEVGYGRPCCFQHSISRKDLGAGTNLSLMEFADKNLRNSTQTPKAVRNVSKKEDNHM